MVSGIKDIQSLSRACAGIPNARKLARRPDVSHLRGQFFVSPTDSSQWRCFGCEEAAIIVTKKPSGFILKTIHNVGLNSALRKLNLDCPRCHRTIFAISSISGCPPCVKVWTSHDVEISEGAVFASTDNV